MASDIKIINSNYLNIKNSIKDAMDYLALDIKDKFVLLKPNLIAMAEPEQAVNTHPAVIEAVIEECIERGASKVLFGDNSGQVNYGNIKRVIPASGMEERLGKYYINMGLDLEKRHLNALDMDVYTPKCLSEADIIIDLPKFKTHKITGITGAIKNTFGYMPGGQKSRIHVYCDTQDKFAEALAEIHMFRKPDAVITDAILGMQGNGASSKDLKYIGKLLVSKDPVAIDTLQANMMGLDPARVIHLGKAVEMGIGTMEYTTNVPVEVIEDFQLAPGYVNPEVYRHSVGSDGLYQDAMLAKTIIEKDKCVQCGACVKQCPLGSLEMVDGYPAMVKEKCVGCHACQEVCPQKALYLSRDEKWYV